MSNHLNLAPPLGERLLLAQLQRPPHPPGHPPLPLLPGAEARRPQPWGGGRGGGTRDDARLRQHRVTLRQGREPTREMRLISGDFLNKRKHYFELAIF